MVRRRELVDVCNPSHRKALKEISHFSWYALAIYTWYLYLFARPCSGGCELLSYSCTAAHAPFTGLRAARSGAPTALSTKITSTPAPTRILRRGGATDHGVARRWHGRRRQRLPSDHLPASVLRWPPRIGRGAGLGSGGGVSIRGDNWLGIHEAGLLRVAGFHRGCEAVDAHFSSGIFATPYCVLVDHEWRCVVISIRGTMSLEDCVYDLHAEPASIEEYGRKWGFDGRGVFTHQGVLERAEWMRQDLETQGHLRALLGLQTATNRRPRLQSYSLYVTGHSLEGSTGVLLSYVLQKDYPSVSQIHGRTMERMRDEVLELIARSKANKLTVMRSIVRNVLRSWGEQVKRKEHFRVLLPAGRIVYFKTHKNRAHAACATRAPGIPGCPRLFGRNPPTSGRSW